MDNKKASDYRPKTKPMFQLLSALRFLHYNIFCSQICHQKWEILKIFFFWMLGDPQLVVPF